MKVPESLVLSLRAFADSKNTQETLAKLIAELLGRETADLIITRILCLVKSINEENTFIAGDFNRSLKLEIESGSFV